MKVAVTAASGQLGVLVLDALLARLHPSDIIAVVRNPAKLAAYAEKGITLREADYNDEAALQAALTGADRLLLISSSEVGQREAQHRHVINAAKAAGVGFVTYTSLLHADSSPLSLAEEHLATEALLKDSAIPHAILRNGWYTENLTGNPGPALEHGVLIGASGEGRFSTASRKDFAEAAAIVLTGEGHTGKIYELAGDNSYTRAELAATLSELSGKPVGFKNMSMEEYAGVLTEIGLPEGLSFAIAGWDAAAASQCLEDDSKTLSMLLGRPTTPYAESVKAALAAL
ncbi:SDR family oxidoreductase [Pokkaliibacter sp. CJK22405]|uniref:SDR family oxidoreductase n=1 Tax=Pokkaliibacter sp. CJK22405 TaxID=3384615 RepID=UPI00398534DD